MRTFKIRHLMLGVAGVAVLIAAIPLIASPPVDHLFLDRMECYLTPRRTPQWIGGVCLVAACVGCLLVVRTYDLVSTHRSRGLPVSSSRVASIACASAIAAFAMILLPDLAFLIVYTFAEAHALARTSHGSGDNIAGILFGIPVALAVASLLRRRLWPGAMGPWHPTADLHLSQLEEPIDPTGL